MLKSLLKLNLLIALSVAFFACSDDDSSIEYLFEREATEITVLRTCPSKADSGASCYQVRFHYPMMTDELEGIYVWVGDEVMDDTSKAVNSDQLEKADAYFEYSPKTTALYDTIDMTKLVADYVDTYDSVHVAIFCEYGDDASNGSVQHVYLHFGDDIPPSRVDLRDSVWTTGVLLEWDRPTDQTDFYKPSELSGPIVGYNLVLWSEDTGEDLRDLKIKLETPDGVDSTGEEFFKRHARVRRDGDSVWIDTVSHGNNVKNYLRLVVIDGKGYSLENDSLNRFRMTVEGLRSMTKYTVSLSSWDSSGNSSGNEGLATVEKGELFITTDSIAPLMPTKIFTIEDTLFPGMARLDSNNRLRIFWSRSVDPLEVGDIIDVDSVLTIPSGCIFEMCYDTVASYVVEHYDAINKKWIAYSDVGGSGRYAKLYTPKGDTMAVSATGTFVTDTIWRVSPGDTLILRIRSVDKSGYYSAALVDTIVVSPGSLASEVTCPDGFVPVRASDTSSVFCMERMEHQNESGEFVVNVLHSEAMAACEAIEADGFKVELCSERDWEQVCLAGGTHSYGVVEEFDRGSSEYLFFYCNVATNDSVTAFDATKRDSRCLNPMGTRDMPGQLQEWVVGRSKDTLQVLKGASYRVFTGMDRESMALCTNRFFPYYTRLDYTKDSVYLYREGAKVDTVFVADTSRTLYKILTQKDFKDSLQFFAVQDSNGNSLGMDYALYSEYKKGGDEWLAEIAGSLVYVPDHIEVVFLKKERLEYRKAAAFYRSSSIGFRCCAYPE
ncbi:MAG: fibronectin type III domain-containing protein [Fibrobacter sp.]|nr:fibronectin type III domain-containing protein [Fibrobacter sp.]